MMANELMLTLIVATSILSILTVIRHTRAEEESGIAELVLSSVVGRYARTYAALILVGGLMMAPLADIAWDDPEIAIPAFLTVAMIPLTFSIANGLAFGITAYALLKLLRGRISRSDWLLLVLSVLFVARFVWLSAG